MRWVENLLLIMGWTALGMTAGGFGLAALGLLTIFRDRPGEQPSMNWGAVYGAIGSLLCGGILGGIVGFAVAISSINQRDETPWAMTTWLGIAAGSVTGLTLCLSGFPANSDAVRGLLTFWPTAGLFIFSTGTIGGMLGSLMKKPRPTR